jgi:hypothetical protein
MSSLAAIKQSGNPESESPMNAMTQRELVEISNGNEIDTLGALLAKIADLTKQAESIKDGIKDSASKGGAKVVEGAMFKATYIESNRSVFDKEAFVKVHGANAYAAFTKVTAVFSVKVTSR